MYRERWNEICFLLSENIHKEISEDLFEKYVIQALRVLGWKQFTGDLEIRPSFQVGASNRITPDFIIKSKSNDKLFVIEIKQPYLPLSTGFQKQLFSYMRLLKLDYGLLIGKEIQIFYDGDGIEHDDPQLLETISFESDSNLGERFAELFSKESFNKDSLNDFLNEHKRKIENEKQIKELTEELLSYKLKSRVIEAIKKDLCSKFDEQNVNEVLDRIEIQIFNRAIGGAPVESDKMIDTSDKQILAGCILKSHNKSVAEFSEFIAEKYIENEEQKETFLKDGVWMKIRLNYIAGLILTAKGKALFSPKEIRDILREELIPSLKEFNDSTLSGMLLTSDVHIQAANPKWHNGYPCLEKVGNGQYRFIGFNSMPLAQDDKGFEGKRVVEQASFKMNNEQYQLKRFACNSIRIFNSDDEIVQKTVKPVLRKINDEYELKIELRFDSGHLKNTRTLGMEVIRALNKKV